jgi:Domain of unknown function (DUF5123)/Domain of unknown function (DUF4957)
MRKIFFALTIIILTLAACKKTEELSGPDRLFRPVLKEALASEGNWIAVLWEPIKDATSYTIRLSKDSFRTILSSATVDTTYHLFENLKWEQLYQVQVKANAKDSSKNSKFSDLGSIKTPKFPTILNTPGVSDVTDNAVKVSWTTSGAAVTSIKILKTSDSSVIKQVDLTATDVTNQYKIVSGLTGSTGYTVFLYSGTSVRGWADFTTKAPFAGTVIDLRGISGRPNVLADTLPLIPSGSTVLLDRSQTYNISSAVNLSKSVIITSGADLTASTQAAIYFTSNFNFNAGAVIDSIEFNDVYMKSDNYGSRYIFNTTNSATVGKMKFMNSKMEIFRGIVRLQSGTATVNNFIVNNCIIDSISGYGIITVDNTAVKADNISITNSTIYKAEKVITSTKQAAGSTSVLVSNCTFNETITGTSTYIDYGSANVTNGITVSNCIFGVGKSGSTTIRDVKTGSSTIVNTPGNNYRTSDYVSAGAANDLPNIQVYPKPSTQLWQDPINGNFKIIDNSFAGRTSAGDPRWRQ